MLPTNYRFVVENLTGGTIPINGVTVIINRTKIGPTDNAVNPDTALTLQNSAIILNNAFGIIGASPWEDNNVGKFIEGNGNYEVNTAGTNGDARLYMQTSPNGTKWPMDALAQIRPAVLNFTSATTKDRDFEF